VRALRHLVFVPGLLLLAGPARAADGELEINQATALAGGVSGSLAEDPPGFPVRITRSGSYRLTSDLEVANVLLDGIVIAAGVSDVTIDFAGFTLRGTSGVNVTPPLWQCTGGGTGSGHGIRAEIQIPLPQTRNVSVRNGRIRNMGGGGLWLFDASRVERMDVERNCGDGVLLGNGSVVTATRVRANRLDGIRCGNGCQVIDSAAEENSGLGIELLSAGLVRGTLARGNGSVGIRVLRGSRVLHGVAVANGVANSGATTGIALEGGDSSATACIANRNAGAGLTTTGSDAKAFVVEDENAYISFTGQIAGCVYYPSSDLGRVCP